jgi:hypothetical protein
VQTVARGIQVSSVRLYRSATQVLIMSYRMGKLERKSSHITKRSYIPLRSDRAPTANPKLMSVVVGHLPVHAMRSPTSQARDTHLQGQVLEYG